VARRGLTCPIRKKFFILSDHTSVQCRSGGNDVDKAQLDKLAELVVQRLSLAQDVAAAKYTSGNPIDDPVRELEILQWAARALNGSGLYQRIGMQFFRDQIEANKVIQRELHHRWNRHPEEVPAVNPDLASEIRPKLDQLTRQISQQFRCINKIPRFACGDIKDLIDRKFPATTPGVQLPKLHRNAAIFAMRSFCAEFQCSMALILAGLILAIGRCPRSEQMPQSRGYRRRWSSRAASWATLVRASRY
jgi:chorismate mutase